MSVLLGLHLHPFLKPDHPSPRHPTTDADIHTTPAKNAQKVMPHYPLPARNIQKHGLAPSLVGFSDCHYPVIFVLAPCRRARSLKISCREKGKCCTPRASNPVVRTSIRSYNQKVKKSMTPTRPALMPAISRLGAAGLSVDVGDGGATWPPLLLPVAEGTVE